MVGIDIPAFREYSIPFFNYQIKKKEKYNEFTRKNKNDRKRKN